MRSTSTRILRLSCSAAAIAAGSIALASCAPSPVIVDMNFPTTAAFMHSDQGRLRIFPLTTEQLGLCPQLLDGLPTENFAGLDPVFDSQLTGVCAFRGGLAVPEFGQGPHAYVVEMRSASNDLILQGCSVGEVYSGAPGVRVQLHPTDAYSTLPATPPPGTPTSRCGGGGS